MVFLYPIAYHNVQFRDKVGRQYSPMQRFLNHRIGSIALQAKRNREGEPLRRRVGRQGKTASKLQKDQGSCDCPEDGKSETDRQKEYLYTINISFVNSMLPRETGNSTE